MPTQSMPSLSRRFSTMDSSERGNGFWLAGMLASVLALLSWANRPLIKYLNEVIFYQDWNDVHGWWVYTVLRLGLVGYFLYVVLGFKTRPHVSQPARAGSGKGLTSEKTFDPLMGLRALACFMVVMGHYFMVTMRFPSGSTYKWLEALLRSSPWAGVWVFFTLSGFLMGKGFVSGRYSLDESGVRLFLRNRFLRIAPIYYIGLFLISVFRYPDYLQWKNWWMIFEMGTFDYRGNQPINPIGALWSVSTEVQFYLLAPMLSLCLIYLSRRLGKLFPVLPVLLLLAGTLLRLLVRVHTHDMYNYGYAPLISNLDLFVLDLSLNLFPKLKRKPVNYQALLGPGLLAAGVLMYVLIAGITAGHRYLAMPELIDYWVYFPAVCVLMSSAFIYFTEQGKSIVVKPDMGGYLMRALQWAGTLTYCIYVFHSEIFLVVSNGLTLPISFRSSLDHFPILILEVIGVAWCFYHFVEKPFEKRKKISGSGLLDAP